MEIKVRQVKQVLFKICFLGFPGGGLGGFPSSFGGIPGFGAMPQNGDFVNSIKKLKKFACSDVYFQGEKGLASLPPGAPGTFMHFALLNPCQSFQIFIYDFVIIMH